MTASLETLPPIRVGERVIDGEAIDREVQYHPAESLGAARRQAALALVIRELLLAEADRLGIDAGMAEPGETVEEARIRILIEREVAVPEPTESDCRRYYESNLQRMRSADEHEVSHILVPAPPDDAEVRAQARQRALQLNTELRADPPRFAAVARTESSCPSRESGGHLGLITRGQTVPEFERALARLPVGQVPEYPVETRFGFHVVLIHHRREGRLLSFEARHRLIADYLREHVRRRAISQYLRLLAAAHDVEGIDLGAADSPLVQ